MPNAAHESTSCHETRTEMAHANRIAILGRLTASIAHEVIQPIGATVTAAEAALHWLAHQPPDLEEARKMLIQIVQDSTRAADIVHRVRALAKNAPAQRERLDINKAIREVIELTRAEAEKNGVSVQMTLAEHLPLIEGDQIQLQQVILNLITNAVEAMSLQVAGARDLLIQTAKTKLNGVFVAVHDSGPGVDPANLERIFDAFFSTKADHLGIGLSTCRAIIQAHAGQLSASRNAPRGTSLHFILPAATTDSVL